VNAAGAPDAQPNPCPCSRGVVDRDGMHGERGAGRGLEDGARGEDLLMRRVRNLDPSTTTRAAASASGRSPQLHLTMLKCPLLPPCRQALDVVAERYIHQPHLSSTWTASPPPRRPQQATPPGTAPKTVFSCRKQVRTPAACPPPSAQRARRWLVLWRGRRRERTRGALAGAGRR
jgi:hypothetical protein